jgi:hypothetical protein
VLLLLYMFRSIVEDDNVPSLIAVPYLQYSMTNVWVAHTPTELSSLLWLILMVPGGSNDHRKSDVARRTTYAKLAYKMIP